MIKHVSINQPVNSSVYKSNKFNKYLNKSIKWCTSNQWNERIHLRMSIATDARSSSRKGSHWAKVWYGFCIINKTMHNRVHGACPWLACKIDSKKHCACPEHAHTSNSRRKLLCLYHTWVCFVPFLHKSKKEHHMIK